MWVNVGYGIGALQDFEIGQLERYPLSLVIHSCRKTSCISRPKSQNLNVSHLVLQLSLPNPMKPGVKSRMKMQLAQRRQAMLQLYLSDQQFYRILRRDLY